MTMRQSRRSWPPNSRRSRKSSAYSRRKFSSATRRTSLLSSSTRKLSGSGTGSPKSRCRGQPRTRLTQLTLCHCRCQRGTSRKSSRSGIASHTTTKRTRTDWASSNSAICKMRTASRRITLNAGFQGENGGHSC